MPDSSEASRPDELSSALVEVQQELEAMRSRSRILRWAAAAGILVVIAVGSVVFYNSEVCEEQLAEDGTIVSVCRHLEATDPPVIATGLLLVALLGPFFSEISVFGVSAKRVEAVEQVGDVLTGLIEHLQETVRDYGEFNRRIIEGQPTTPMPDDASPIDALAHRYNTIRLTEPSGSERTAQMEAIVKQMVDHLAGDEHFDPKPHLEDDDRGKRLAGYAYVFAKPDRSHMADLVKSLEKEDKAFGQYWALKALAEVVSKDRVSLDRETRGFLEDLYRQVPQRSDRARVLQRIMKRTSVR